MPTIYANTHPIDYPGSYVVREWKYGHPTRVDTFPGEGPLAQRAVSRMPVPCCLKARSS